MTVRTGFRRAAGIAGCALAIAVGGVVAAPAAPATAAPDNPAPAAAARAAVVPSASVQSNKCMVAAHFCIYSSPTVVCGWATSTLNTTVSCKFISDGHIVIQVANRTAQRIAFYSTVSHRGRPLGTLPPHASAKVSCRCQVRSFRPAP